MLTKEQKELFERLSKDRKENADVLEKQSMRGVKVSIVDKYSDQAHFIYELLQNADDAEAATARFILNNEGLIFAHNGKIHFSLSDPDKEDEDTKEKRLGHINSITSIGNSNKYESQIGKFGVGFKAVFQYSETPEIYDTPYSFKIDRFIVPILLENAHPERKPDETLFYFPFINPSEAFQDILEKLRGLKNPLLFLRNLNKIEWKTANGQHGLYTKKVKTVKEVDSVKVEKIRLKKRVESDSVDKQSLLVFSNETQHPESFNRHTYSIAYLMKDEKYLSDMNKFPAYCFFPTKETTNLHFIVQAPFLLTDSREGIKEKESWNKHLIQCIGKLTADSISICKSMDLLTEEFFNVLPTDINDFSEKNLFKTVYHEVLKKLQSDESLLPKKDGSFVSKKNGYLADTHTLMNLLDSKQLGKIVKNINAQWIFPTITEKFKIWKYVKDNLTSNSATITPDFFAGQVDDSFMDSQSDEWIIKFYKYLLDGPRSLYSNYGSKLRTKPIIRLSDDKMLSPYDSNSNEPKVYLPSESESEYPTVKQCFVDHKESLDFFKALGLKEPDEYAEIEHFIFPRYEKVGEIDDSILLKDFKKLFSYSLNCPANRKQDYLNKIKKLKFIVARYFDDNQSCQTKAEDVYYQTDSLEKYFDSFKKVYFLDREFYKKIYEEIGENNINNFFKELGISDKPRHIFFEGFVSYKREYNYDIDGLDEAIASIDHITSRFIWDFLLEYCKLNTYDFFKGKRKWFYYKERSEQFDAKFLNTLRQSAWLFDKNGNKVKPSDIFVKDLSDSYITNTDPAKFLIEKLCFKKDEIENIAKYLTDEQKDKYRLGDELSKIAESKGLSPEELLRTLTHQIEHTEKTSYNQKSGEPRPKKQRTRNINDVKFDLSEDRDDEELIPADIKTESIEKRRIQLEERLAQEINGLEKIESLRTAINEAEKYSFVWFKELLELEYSLSFESKSRGREITIQFEKVERDPASEKITILKYPSRYIPHTIEDIADISLQLHFRDDSKNRSISIEVVNVKEYTLRARLKSASEIQGIDLSKVVNAVIDIKDPSFILESLKTAFDKLDFDDNENLKTNLTQNIEFIFGPPGTGKTTYLAKEKIIPLMKDSKELKILVLTPTNKAADVLVNKLTEISEDDSYKNWLVRFGITGDAEIEKSEILKDKFFDITDLKRCTVITTIARFPYDGFKISSDCKLKDYDWDVIIFDEASMITLASIIYVLYKKPECQFVIAGDPFQIQPVVIAEEWKEENIYTLVNLNKSDSFKSPQTEPHDFEIVNLPIQYRSIPPLGKLFSEFTYNGILQHSREIQEKRPLNISGLGLKEITFIRFPVNRFESIYRSQRLEGGSSYQIYSAIFTVEFGIFLSEEIIKTSKENWKIGIICPYAAQATVVEKMLSAMQTKLSQQVEILTGTIHGFQGDEFDIILNLLNPPPSISPNIFLNKQNIINVSVSRAKDYLIFILPENVDGLTKIQYLGSIIQNNLSPYFQELNSRDVEKIIFNQADYIYENSFITTHQRVNVYSKPDKKYEVRCEDNAIDIQLLKI